MVGGGNSSQSKYNWSGACAVDTDAVGCEVRTMWGAMGSSCARHECLMPL